MKQGISELIIIGVYAILLLVILFLIASRMIKDRRRRRDRIRPLGRIK